MRTVRLLAAAVLTLTLAGAAYAATAARAAQRPASRSAARSATAPAAEAGHGLGLAYLDTTCAPCRDFFQYANGGWMAHAEIPASYQAYGANEELEDRNQESLHRLLDDAVRTLAAAPAGSNAQRIGLFYGSCMDSARAESEGAAPLKPELTRIAAVGDLPALATELARLHTTGIGGVFAVFANQDFKDSDQFIAWAFQGGLGLPDRDYYLRSDSASVELRSAYVEHVSKSLQLLGDAPAGATEAAGHVMMIETALAKASMTRVQRRDPKAIYHKMSRAEFEKLAPSFDWAGYFTGMGLGDLSSLNVAQPDFFHAVDSLLKVVPVADWRSYLRWKVVDHAEPLLSSAFVNEDFRFRQRLTGAKVLDPRWKRCLRATDGSLGEALGEAYVAKAFPPDAKARALDMVKNLESTLEGRLGRLAWMNDSTRTAAIGKLRAIRNKIGYPDQWRDYSAMHLTAGSYYANALEADRFEVHRSLAKIGKPVDRTEWRMTPPTVNAYYSPSMNEVVFPAGILQPPFFFFDKDADDAVNYGATGATIGHEMTHGFDDSGRQFDAKGNLRDWWTTTDEKRYKAAAARVVNQFNGFVAVDTLHINGRLTLGENIADLGGLVIAYEAFEKTLAGKPRKLVDGFTPEQRFFIAYGQSWRWIWRPERTRRLVLTDPHSPPKWRTNGPLENMPEFARAFGCHAGDPMVAADSLRAEIW